MGTQEPGYESDEVKENDHDAGAGSQTRIPIERSN